MVIESKAFQVSHQVGKRSIGSFSVTIEPFAYEGTIFYADDVSNLLERFPLTLHGLNLGEYRLPRHLCGMFPFIHLDFVG